MENYVQYELRSSELSRAMSNEDIKVQKQNQPRKQTRPHKLIGFSGHGTWSSWQNLNVVENEHAKCQQRPRQLFLWTTPVCVGEVRQSGETVVEVKLLAAGRCGKCGTVVTGRAEWHPLTRRGHGQWRS